MLSIFYNFTQVISDLGIELHKQNLKLVKEYMVSETSDLPIVTTTQIIAASSTSHYVDSSTHHESDSLWEILLMALGSIFGIDTMYIVVSICGLTLCVLLGLSFSLGRYIERLDDDITNSESNDVSPPGTPRADDLYLLRRQSSNLESSNLEYLDNWVEEYSMSNPASVRRIHENFLKGNISSIGDFSVSRGSIVNSRGSIGNRGLEGIRGIESFRVSRGGSRGSQGGSRGGSRGVESSLVRPVDAKGLDDVSLRAFLGEPKIEVKGKKIDLDVPEPITSSIGLLENETPTEQVEREVIHPENPVSIKNLPATSIADELKFSTLEISSTEEVDLVLQQYSKRHTGESSSIYKSILFADVPSDPVDLFPYNMDVNLDWQYVDFEQFAPEQFQQDLSDLSEETLKLYSFLVSNQYEGESVGLERFIFQIKTHVNAFIDKLYEKHQQLVKPLICLVTDIITFSDDESISLEDVIKFFLVLLEWFERETELFNVITSSLIVTSSSLAPHVFVQIFNRCIDNGLTNKQLRLMLKAYSFYLCFNMKDLTDESMSYLVDAVVEFVSTQGENIHFFESSVIFQLRDIILIIEEGHKANSNIVETQAGKLNQVFPLLK